MKRVYTNSQARLRKSPSKGETLLKIPKWQICELLDVVTDVQHSGMKTTWLKIRYRGKIGYSYEGFFDDYNHPPPENIVDLQGIQTADPYDAQQYIIWDGQKKVNMCGEICVSHITKFPLDEVLKDWTRKAPNIVSRIFGGSTDRGTGYHTLVKLLENMGRPNGQSLNAYFKDKLLGRTIFTLPRAHEALRHNEIIMGVKIGRDGYVGTGSILHWVTLESVEIFGKQAICVIFNPYMNREEIYSWSELIKSGANIDGVVVPRLESDDVEIGS